MVGYELTEKEIAVVNDIFSEDIVIDDRVRPYNLTKKVKKGDEGLEVADEIGSEVNSRIQRFLQGRYGEDVVVSFSKHRVLRSQVFFSDFSLNENIIIPWHSTSDSTCGALIWPLELFYFFYNRSLGGVFGYEKKGDLTEIELQSINTISSSILGTHDACWGPPRTDLTFNGDMLILSQNDMEDTSWAQDFLIGKYTVSSGESAWDIHMAYPKTVLKPLAAQGGSANKHVDKDWVNMVRNNIMDLAVDITTVLGVVDVTFQQVMEIKEGDVFQLNIFDQQYPVLIDGKTQWLANAGVAGDRQAIKIIKGVNDNG